MKTLLTVVLLIFGNLAAISRNEYNDCLRHYFKITGMADLNDFIVEFSSSHIDRQELNIDDSTWSKFSLQVEDTLISYWEKKFMNEYSQFELKEISKILDTDLGQVFIKNKIKIAGAVIDDLGEKWRLHFKTELNRISKLEKEQKNSMDSSTIKPEIISYLEYTNQEKIFHSMFQQYYITEQENNSNPIDWNNAQVQTLAKQNVQMMIQDIAFFINTIYPDDQLKEVNSEIVSKSIIRKYVIVNEKVTSNLMAELLSKVGPRLSTIFSRLVETHKISNN